MTWERAALTLAVIAFTLTAVSGMRRGWRRRGMRQSDLPSLPMAPAPRVSSTAVPGLYVATTSADQLLDRIVVHGLGHRGRAQLFVEHDGVRIVRDGEVALWLPVADIAGVRLGSGQAQKAVEAGGLILIRWRLGDRELETGFRADSAQSHVDTARAIAAFAPTAGGIR